MNNGELKPINIPVDKLELIKCPVCKGIVFKQCFQLRKVPAIVSPTSKKEILATPVYVCNNCDQLIVLEDAKIEN
jgi:hypothetical protein